MCMIYNLSFIENDSELHSYTDLTSGRCVQLKTASLQIQAPSKTNELCKRVHGRISINTYHTNLCYSMFSFYKAVMIILK